MLLVQGPHFENYCANRDEINKKKEVNNDSSSTVAYLFSLLCSFNSGWPYSNDYLIRLWNVLLIIK